MENQSQAVYQRKEDTVAIQTDIYSTTITLTVTISSAGGNADSGTPAASQKVSIENFTGYIGGILKVTSGSAYLDEIDQIRVGWRPQVTSDPGRYVPLFIDLLDDTADIADLPSFAALANLSGDVDLEEGHCYYVYFVHPETPAAVPLFKDMDDANPFGIEFKASAHADAGAANRVLALELRVFYQSWPAAS